MEGFAAQITESEFESLQKLPDVIAIRPEMRIQVQTTYPYKFLGLNPTNGGAFYTSQFGHGTIIVVLDTLVWPESPSFDDLGMPPVPKNGREFAKKERNSILQIVTENSLVPGCLLKAIKWLQCHRHQTLFRNMSPRDLQGYGTHTTSTAAGASVPMASVLSNAAGVPRGMATGAPIAT